MVGRLNYVEINTKAIQSLMAAKAQIGSIDRKLRALVELRVSQINGCVYCVDLHTNEARAAGETTQRLDCLPVWRESDFFAGDERAALAWAESITMLPSEGAPNDLYDNLTAHFSDLEIVDLTHIIAQMNAWNRLAVGFHHLPDERGA